MPAIPYYNSQVDARSISSNSGRVSNPFTADAMGGSAARALGAAAEGVADVGDTLRYERQTKEKEQTLYNVAMADFSPIENELQKTMSPDGEGYKDAIKTSYVNWVDEQSNGIEDNNVRKATKEQLLARLPSYVNRADTLQQATSLATSKDRANQVIYRQQNVVMNDPTQLDTALQMSNEAIDLQTKIPAPLRESMKVQNGYDFHKTAFTGQLQRAKTVADLDAVAAQLQQPDAQGSLMPRDYDDLMGKIVTAKKTLRTESKAQSNALLKDLEERSKDPKYLIPAEEIKTAQAAVAATGDISEQQRLARVMRNDAIVRSERKLTPRQLREQIKANTNSDGVDAPTPGAMPTRMANAINNVSSRTGVDAGYLDATAKHEFGGELSKPEPNYAMKNPDPASSATGVYQFTQDTFIRMSKDPAVRIALGITPEMTDAQVLAMREDPEKATLAAALLAKSNKGYMEGKLGRPVNNTELYAAHFLGAPAATTFLDKMSANPDGVAASAFADEAKANPGVFYNRDAKGKIDTSSPKTYTEVYQGLGRTFSASTSQVAYEDNQVRENLLAKAETALSNGDGLEWAAGVGAIELAPLDQDGGFKARSTSWRKAGDYYGQSVLPFTKPEEAWLQKQITEGDTNQALGVLAAIQQMGPEAARAGFAQLKVKSPAFGQAGMLALDGDPATAADIVRGVKRMKENPASVTGLKMSQDTASADFENAVGGSMREIDPGQRQAVQEAALAYLVEQSGSRGKAYSKDDYQGAIRKVLGGRVESFNGDKTLMPKNLTSGDVYQLFAAMDVADYISLSPNGKVPQHGDGEAIDPVTFDGEVRLAAIGDDKYYLKDGEGNFIITGERTPYGQPVKFILDLKADRVKPMLEVAKKKAREVAQANVGVPVMRGGF